MIEQHTEYYDVGGNYSFNCMNDSITDHANRGWFVKTMINLPRFSGSSTDDRILIVYEREIAEDKKKDIIIK